MPKDSTQLSYFDRRIQLQFYLLLFFFQLKYFTIFHGVFDLLWSCLTLNIQNGRRRKGVEHSSYLAKQ